MNQCLFCQKIIKQDLSLKEILSFKIYHPSWVCSKCLDQAQPIDLEKACPICSRPNMDTKICDDCQFWEQVINHQALFIYNDFMADWLFQLKTIGDVRAINLFNAYLKLYYQSLEQPITVAPIPSSPSSLKKRGFNPCQALLQAARIPYQDLLVSNYKGEKQSEKSRQSRLLSRNPFKVQGDLDSNQAILLFDDVYTTGRTMRHAYQSLAEAGYKNVKSFSLSR